MLARPIKSDSDVTLIGNTGIQFLDFEVDVDLKKSSDIFNQKHAKGYFVPFNKVINTVRLVADEGDEVEFLHPLENFKTVGTDDALEVLVSDSLKLFNEVWFPIPYLYSKNSKENGPLNWARARIVELTDEYIKKYNEDSSTLNIIKQDNKTRYRITVALDTKIYKDANLNGYFAPTESDLSSGGIFEFAYTQDKMAWFLGDMGNGKPWVNEWCESIFLTFAKERLREYKHTKKSELQDVLDSDHLHEVHYLNVLSFLGTYVSLPKIKMLSNAETTNSKDIEVSLILDIGNSRTCGMMVEKHPTAARNNNDFVNIHTLNIRDLNASENVYEDAFESRVEFSKANFDFDNKSPRSGRPDAFDWPSLVRVGVEASTLSSLKNGTEGITGLSSPKRYLWSDTEGKEAWRFNPYQYQINSESFSKENKERNSSAELMSIKRYINSNGHALFALNDYETSLSLSPTYSHKSCMTFMLVEIINQAISQMNSFAQRDKNESSKSPRVLSDLILTVPPSMPIEEREIIRCCVYEALGIVWKSLGYDKSNSRDKFNFSCKDKELMYPFVPNVHIDWDEAQSCQVVYLFNEQYHNFKGRSDSFIKYLRRRDIENRISEQKVDERENKLISTRIATIDVGGGTSDLVIIDYSLKDREGNFADNIIPNEIYRDGIRQAGDDIVEQILRQTVLSDIDNDLKERGFNEDEVYQIRKDFFTSSPKNVKEKVAKGQLAQQLLMKVGIRIVEHLEVLDIDSLEDIYLTGTIKDFLLNNQVNSSLKTKIPRSKSYNIPSSNILDIFNDKVRYFRNRNLSSYDILNVNLNINLTKIHNDMMSGVGYEYRNTLTKLTEVLNLFDVDVLLLTGRPSKMPFFRQFMIENLSLPISRIISMHDYYCSWYPIKSDTLSIGDPKTTASIGALLSCTRLNSNNWENFRYSSKAKRPESTLKYLGLIENDDTIKNDAVIYRRISKKALLNMQATLGEDNTDDVSINTFERVTYDKNTHEFIVDDDSGATFYSALAAHFGSRQLNDPSFKATPLYRISLKDSVDTISTVVEARKTPFPDTNLDVLNLLTKINDNIPTDSSKDIKLDEIKDIYQRRYDGLKERYDELFVNKPLDVDEDDFEFDVNILSQDVLSTYIDLIVDLEKIELSKVEQYATSRNNSFGISLKLNTKKDKYPFISNELKLSGGDDLSLLSVTIASIKYASNKECKKYFDLKLQTVSSENAVYWLESCLIKE